MTFRISGLDPAPFRHFYGLPDESLSQYGAKRYEVDSHPGFPDRIEMRDLDIGEKAILVNYMHQPAATAYRSSHAIFVREGAEQPAEFIGEVPEVMRIRQISLRAFDAGGYMIDAVLVDGTGLKVSIERFLENPDTSYLHAHNAQRGCFAGKIVRA
ncbi:DUF1203 domain-containing protein [Qipengyuania sp. 6D47A]|uniref:DUF1203 domain-containing protein n=2 Tax=Qipengyuania qiaonensis TaxID=2867240 RepID=A0ABS7J957_9SPHN|nr:DUF1203 domain-containing protein [Qipengyuania qiaonensis]